jgi:hypothetical protein
MRINVRRNTCCDDIGEVTFDDGSSKIQFDYDRDDLAHELINTYFDMYRDRDEAMRHLSMYLDKDDIKAMI